MITIREVLFKAKRTDNGKWIEGSLIRGVFVRCADNQDIPYILNIDDIECDYDNFGDLTDGFGYYEVNPDTICQFTGLIDKNGNKIFENDIVGRYSEYQEKYYCGQVGYGEFNCSCCNGVYGWYFGEEDIRDYQCYEVLGNIFDNPELLEK